MGYIPTPDARGQKRLTRQNDLGGVLFEIVSLQFPTFGDNYEFFNLALRSIPEERLNLVWLLDLEPEGIGISYSETAEKGTFRSKKPFFCRHGFKFAISHADYKLTRLRKWFDPTNGGWDEVLGQG